MNILPKLEAIAERHKKLSVELSQPDAVDDMDRFTTLNKEYAELTPIVGKYKEYRDLLQERESLQAMATDDSDPEMKEMAELELASISEKIPGAEEELKLTLVPKDAADDRNSIIEIRAGTGGDEAALFASDLYRMYTMYAEKKHWKVEELSRSDTPLGGVREVVAMITGNGVFAK